MIKKSSNFKKYENKILYHIYALSILLILFLGRILYLKMKAGDQPTILYLLLLGGTSIFIFLEIKHIFSLFDLFENSNSLFRYSFNVLENINIYIIDLGFNYLYMNDADIDFMTKYYGTTPKVGENVSNYLSKNHFELLKKNIDTSISKGFQTSRDSFKYHGKDIYLYSSYSPVKNKKGQVYAVCCITTNVTDEIIEKEKFMELIYEDPLTHVFNRRKIQSYYNEMDKTKNFWIVIFDLDNFKNSNDKFGHTVGDQILKKFSKILQIEFPESSIISRIGGDEFCVILEDMSYPSMIRLLSAVELRMKEFAKYGVSVSMGEFYVKQPAPLGLDYYIQQADKKMYQHKNFQKDQQKQLSEDTEGSRII